MRHINKLLLALILPLNCFSAEPVAPETAPKIEITPVERTLNFAKSHQEFRDLYFKQHEQEFLRLVHEGQNPQTIFIGCSDSRVVPDLIIGTRPGDLFVIRTAGNFVLPYDPSNCQDGVSASIQYGLEVLDIRHIVVCGHSHCGAIQGLFKQLDPTSMGLVQKWLRAGEPAKKITLLTLGAEAPREELYKTAEQISVVYQLENLMTYPFIKDRVSKGTLELHGWYFTIESGMLEYYDGNDYRFKPLSEKSKI